MNIKGDAPILASAAVVFREGRGGEKWLIVNEGEEAGWELPKTLVRRGESSVRAVIRMTSEQAGINARVLEDAGRFTAPAKINNKIISKTTIYYLLFQKSAGEVLAFSQPTWLDYSKVVAKLKNKKELAIFKEAREIQKAWAKKKAKKVSEEE